MKILEPTGCVYWTKPELAFRPGRTLDQFETIETLERNMHELKQLLKCRECGQQYFYEFWEEMHFDGRDDSQFVTLVPVESAGDVEFLSKKTYSGHYARLVSAFARIVRVISRHDDSSIG